jgi:hypothetical protein
MSTNVTNNRKISVKRKAAAVALSITAAAGVSVGLAPSAEAAAYPIGVYAPNRINSGQIQGWANLSRDCSGTYGCYNYIKIERARWYGVEYVNGWWANNNGWNSITANLPSGCYNYRTTTDSYNDVAGGYGGGVNIGPVGASGNGTKIYRYRNTWSSGWTYQCH